MRHSLPKRAFRVRFSTAWSWKSTNSCEPIFDTAPKILLARGPRHFPRHTQNAALPRLATLYQVCAALTLRFIKTTPLLQHKMLCLPEILKFTSTKCCACQKKTTRSHWHASKALRLPRKMPTLPPGMSQNATKARKHAICGGTGLQHFVLITLWAPPNGEA